MVQSLSFLKSGVQVGVGANAVSLSATSSGLQFVDAQSNTTVITPGDAVGGGGATIVANNASLPLVGLTAGQFAFSTANSQLFISNGSGWYKIALINETPTITLSTESIVLPSETFVDVTYTVVEPEGTPVTITVSNSAIANTSLAKVVHFSSNNTIRVFANTTGFSGATITVSASDGVNIGVDSTTFQVTALVDDSKQTKLLLNSEATLNLADNLTFTDESDSNHTMTPAGNVYMTGKSPYAVPNHCTLSTWSISGGASNPSGTGDYTVEFWLYSESGINDIGNGGNVYQNGHLYVMIKNSVLYGTNTVFVGSNGGTQINTGVQIGSEANQHTWYHFAIVYESGVFKCYVNGVKVANEWTTTIDHTSTSLTGGYVTGTSGRVLMADLRVTTEAVYTENFTPPTEVLPVLGNTILSIFNNETAYDRSGTTDATLITANRLGAFNPYDHSGWSTSVGGSIHFVSSNPKVSCPNTAALDLGTGDFTVEFWLWTDNTDTKSLISSSGSGGMSIGYTSNTIRLGRVPFTSTSDITFTGSALADYQWNHIAIARNASIGAGSTSLWINGHLIDTGTSTNSYNFTGNLQLGIENISNWPLDGYLSDVRIVKGTAVYDSSAGDFTPPSSPLAKVSGTSLLVSGKGAAIIDKTGNFGFYPSAGGVTASTTQTKYSTTSMYFPTSTSALSMNATDGAESLYFFGNKGKVTIEFWIYATSDGTIFSGGGNQLGTLSLSSGTLTHTQSNSMTASFTSNQWNHVAITKDSGGWEMFLNGTSVDTAATSQLASSSSVGLVVGSGSSSFTGYIEDFKISSGLRYTTTFTPPTKLLG